MMAKKNLIYLSFIFVFAVLIRNSGAMEALRPEDEGVLWSVEVNEGDETRGILTQVVEGTLVQREVNINDLPIAKPFEVQKFDKMPNYGAKKVRIIEYPKGMQKTVKRAHKRTVRIVEPKNKHIQYNEPEVPVIDEQPYEESYSDEKESYQVNNAKGKYPRAIRIQRADGKEKVMHWRGDERFVSDEVEVPVYREVDPKRPIYEVPPMEEWNTASEAEYKDEVPMADNRSNVPMIDEDYIK